MTQSSTIMVPGYGALPVAPPKYNPANDNVPERERSAPAAAVSRETIPSGNMSGVDGGKPLFSGTGNSEITGKGIKEEPWFRRANAKKAPAEEHRKLYVWNGEGATAEAFYKPGTDCLTGANDGRLGASFFAGDLELPTTTFAPLEQLPAAIDISGTFELAPDSPSIEEFAAGLRFGDYLQTYTGRKFWAMDPRADEVHIEDIAHSLSLQCRYAGHCIRFVSVAEHSIHIAWWLFRHYGPVTALCGLMHDAAEAYLVDVPRPVKPYLAGYRDAEARVMAAVSERFGLPPMPAAVKEADDRIIGDELVNMHPMDWHARYDDPLGVTLMYLSPAEAEAKFLASFAALSEQVRGMEI